MRLALSLALALSGAIGARAALAAPADCAGLHCDRFHELMAPGQAPPLDRPRTIANARARRLLGANDLVVGVSLHGAERAYPLALLGYHRVVNDRVAGARVAVAHSPLSGATLCVSGEELRASGLLFESDDVLLDARTGDLWSLLAGRSLGGPRHGQALPRIPCAVMRFATWQRLAPRGRVAWPARPALPGFDYRRDPWAWYRADDQHLEAQVRYLDLRLPRKQVVVGLAAGHDTRAIALPRWGKRVLELTIAGEPIVVVLDGEGRLAIALSRRLPGRTLALELDGGALRDRASGERWSLLGTSLSRTRGASLAAAPGAAVSYFFAWAAFHPGTNLAAELAGSLAKEEKR